MLQRAGIQVSGSPSLAALSDTPTLLIVFWCLGHCPSFYYLAFHPVSQLQLPHIPSARTLLLSNLPALVLAYNTELCFYIMSVPLRLAPYWYLSGGLSHHIPSAVPF